MRTLPFPARFLSVCLFSSSLLWHCPETTAQAPEFETHCQSLDSWQTLDLVGDSRIANEADPSVPAGYGPRVIRIEGGELFLLVKGFEVQQGCLLTLWKDNDSRGLDADGVLTFAARYPLDLAVAGNLKERARHVWVEQDGDEGFQIKEELGTEKPAVRASLSGMGITDGEWNLFGWMWQKVRIDESGVAAKFWAFGTPEPSEWSIHIEGWLPDPGRVGLKVFSGSASIAYFALSREEISPPLPDAVVAGSPPVAYSLDSVRFAASINLEQPLPSGRVQLIRTDGTKEFLLGEVSRNLPEGNSSFVFGKGGEEVRLGTEASLGRTQFRLEVLNRLSERILDATCAVELCSAGQVESTLAGMESEARSRLSAFSTYEDAAATEPLAALAHLRHARERVARSRIAEAERSIDLAAEALDRDAQLIPFACDRISIPALSWVMGDAQEIEVTWRATSDPPTEKLTARLTLTDDLRVETPLSADLPIPATAWAGNRPTTRFVLPIPHEFPPGSETPIARPALREGYHRLWISLHRPDGTPEWIDLPGAEVGSFTNRYEVARVYVTQNPVRIDAISVGPNLQDEVGSLGVDLTHLGTEPLYANLVTTLLTPSGRPVWTGVQSLTLEAAGKMSLDLPIEKFRWFGDLVVAVRVERDGVLLTEASRKIAQPAPEGWKLSLSRGLETLFRAGSHFVPLKLNATVPPGVSGAVRLEVGNAGSVLFDDRVDFLLGQPGEKQIEVPPALGTNNATLTVADRRGEKWSTEVSYPAPVFENRAGVLHLNGEPFIVKGVNVHGMISDSPERSRHVMRFLKDIGFNSLRGDYPPVWQMEMAEEENLGYMVLAPFSVTNTNELESRLDPHAYARAREITRRFIRTYRDEGGVWFWNSCNEIEGNLDDFLVNLYALYRAMDPARRPVVYANLYGQDRTIGQDLMAVNYYFGPPQRAVDRQPLLARSLDVASKAGIPCIFTEFNSWYGPVYSTGAEAVRDLFEYGVELGMAGGYLFMLGEHGDRHPGAVISVGNLWTNPTFDAALRGAFKDARVTLDSASETEVRIRVENVRPFTLRKIRYRVVEGGVERLSGELPDVSPRAVSEFPPIPVPPADAHVLEVELEFESHYGLRSKITERVLAGE